MTSDWDELPADERYCTMRHELIHVRQFRRYTCLLYTSDAADERSSVDLGGRRIIKTKNNKTHKHAHAVTEKTHTIEEQTNIYRHKTQQKHKNTTIN